MCLPLDSRPGDHSLSMCVRVSIMSDRPESDYMYLELATPLDSKDGRQILI